MLISKLISKRRKEEEEKKNINIKTKKKRKTDKEHKQIIHSNPMAKEQM